MGTFSWNLNNLNELQQSVYLCLQYLSLYHSIQQNPDFSNPRFFEPRDNSNQSSFSLDLLHSSTVILPPISRTLDYSKLPETRTNSRLPWEKFPEKLPSITRTFEIFQTN